MLTESHITGLKPLVKSAVQKGKKVLVTCVGQKSGKTALSLLQSAYPGASVRLITSFIEWEALGGLGWKYRDFYLIFDDENQAALCASEISAAVAEAIADGTFGAGENSLKSDFFSSGKFFKSNFFYAAISIIVIIIAATIGVRIVQKNRK